jgi:phosphoribosylglycinamide formyltransferase-1
MDAELMTPLRLAVLISGGGSTLLNLLDKIDQGELNATVECVIASRKCVGVERSTARGHVCEVISAKKFATPAELSRVIFDRCRAAKVDLVILGGFLSRIEVPADYEGRVLNIHPSLIPSFCGHGMYGHHVHEAVLARGCKVSGCTVHVVDNEYDHGPIVVQKVVPVLEGDDADTLARRVFTAECEAYPEAIRLYAQKLGLTGK